MTVGCFFSSEQGERKAPCVNFDNLALHILLVLGMTLIPYFATLLVILECFWGREQAGSLEWNCPSVSWRCCCTKTLCLFSERDMGLCSLLYGVLRLIEKGHYNFFFLFCSVDERLLNEYFKFLWFQVSDLDPLISQLNVTCFCWKCLPHEIIFTLLKDSCIYISKSFFSKVTPVFTSFRTILTRTISIFHLIYFVKNALRLSLSIV